MMETIRNHVQFEGVFVRFRGVRASRCTDFLFDLCIGTGGQASYRTSLVVQASEKTARSSHLPDSSRFPPSCLGTDMKMAQHFPVGLIDQRGILL